MYAWGCALIITRKLNNRISGCCSRYARLRVSERCKQNIYLLGWLMAGYVAIWPGWVQRGSKRSEKGTPFDESLSVHPTPNSCHSLKWNNIWLFVRYRRSGGRRLMYGFCVCFLNKLGHIGPFLKFSDIMFQPSS